MSQGKEKLLRVNVAARRLNRSVRTIQRFIKAGKLQYIEESPRQRYIPESAVEAFRADKS